MHRTGLLLMAIGCSVPAVAHADRLGSMPCTDVRQVLDDIPNRKAEAVEIWNWIGVRFRVDDDSAEAAGHTPIGRKWSQKGLENNEALVTASCGDHRTDTLAERTDDIYDGLLSFMQALGQAI